MLLENGFSMEAVKTAMGSSFPHGDHISLTPAQYQALTTVRITRTGKRIRTKAVQLYVVDNFMSHAECDALIAVSDGKLVPSGIPRPELHHYFRTSSTCQLMYTDAPLVKTISERTASTLGINASYSEGMQLQYYDIGQEFKPHRDYFEPHGEDYKKYANIRGNRTWTFMVYLNETEKGGGTSFPQLGKTFYPKKGRALIWNNLNADGTPNPDTIHCGEPVQAGRKVIITEWFRELGNGPMLLD